jgi:hypothetical protein
MRTKDKRGGLDWKLAIVDFLTLESEALSSVGELGYGRGAKDEFSTRV